jgi:hypothetical protein
MNWILYWFIVYLIELFLWAYIIYLSYEIKINAKKTTPKVVKEKNRIKIMREE